MEGTAIISLVSQQIKIPRIMKAHHFTDRAGGYWKLHQGQLSYCNEEKGIISTKKPMPQDVYPVSEQDWMKAFNATHQRIYHRHTVRV